MAPLNIYKTVFDASPIGSYLLSPEFIILNVNQAFLRATSRKREQLVGFNVFDVFEANPEDKADTGLEAFRLSLTRVIEARKADTLALQRYPIKIYPESGEPYFEERFWSAVNTPIYDEQGELVCIFHTTIDVTELVAIQKQLEAVVADEGELANIDAKVFPRAQAVQEINKALTEERNRLRHLFDRSPGFVYFTHGPDHIIEQVNEAFYDLVGRRNLIGKSIRDTFPEIAPQGFFELHDQVYSTGKPYVNHGVPIWLRRTQDGPLEQRYMDLVYEAIRDMEGKITGICAQGLDVTEVKRVQDELRRHDERWKLALEAAGDGVWDWDLVADQIFYPIPWAKIVGLEERENHSFPTEEWKQLIHPDDLNHVLSKVELHLRGREKTYSVEYRLRGKDDWLWVLARGAVVCHDENGKPTRMVGTITDITESKSTEQKIWYEANFDNLTDLPNRRLFRDRLEQEMRKAQRSGHCVALLFIDLDRFKEVNDLWGHDTGDLLLVEAARRIQNCVRSSDTVARLGGDEFTVILTDFNEKLHVEEISNKLLEALTASFTLGEEEACISASIGITIYPPDATDAEALIRNADQAMYNAKKFGRNQFSFFTKAMQDEAFARLKLIGELREGLARHQFHVVYQPIIELATGRVTKAEALLRWEHPDMGDINPVKFIPLAEESGVINQLGDWVFREAASASVEFNKKYGPNFEISVNRSAMQFQGTGGEFNWAEHLKSMGIQRNSISVEITEGMLVDATPRVVETLLQYRDAGIQVAIDDFGTGYSSMAYLKEFDIDYLKIDQSFIKDINTNPSSSAIARSIIAMAHELDLKVVAEGIETQEQQDVLIAAKCDYGQGFLFSQPLPLSTFISQIH
ncbi:MAG TPA: EAL domain-containing protein [Methylophilaceae bacterium]|nr:EAL domain-containing protein [Methylophilaceae bacterium]